MLEVGQIVKPHGLKGEVIVSMITNRPEERVAPGFVFSSDRGDLTVRYATPHQGRWIVAFAGLVDRDGAEALRGTVLMAEPLAGGDDDDTLWIHELIGAEVVGVDGRAYGTVEAVEANPASDLLVLPGGRLVPLVFVVSGPTAGRLVIDPPAGLLDD
ncbi:MAG: rRNA processing protein RimM [Actinomycetota bacterium]|jgi:16S rRNA processing protein RimM|nr:rRNA processing protein RimM [Actinomycetota bacterium]